MAKKNEGKKSVNSINNNVPRSSKRISNKKKIATPVEQHYIRSYRNESEWKCTKEF